MLRRGFLLIAICYSLLHLTYSIAVYNPFTNPEVSGDFHRPYQEALQMRQDWGSMKAALTTNSFIYYPAFYYLLLRPFTFFPFQVMDYFFYFLQFLLFPLAILLLVRAVSGGRPLASDYLLAGILAVNFHPFLEAMALHKVEGIEFFLISLAIFLFWKGRDYWVGGVLLLAANLKYLPGILILYFLLKRNWKVLLGVVGAGVILPALLWAFTGPDATITLALRHPLKLLFSGNPETNRPVADLQWQTLSGTINRLFALPLEPSSFVDLLHSEYSGISHEGLALRIASFLKLLLGGLYVWIVRERWEIRHREERWPSYLLEISLSLVMMLVFVQAVTSYYGILLLPAFILTGLLLVRRWELFHLKEKGLFFLAYALSGMIIPGGLLNKLPPHPVWGQLYSRLYLWWSLPFYGYLLLGGCILLCLKRVRTSS